MDLPVSDRATVTHSGLFSFKIFREKIVDFPSHRIFGHMHEALNIDKNKINYTI
jgi:hypothetical protein